MCISSHRRADLFAWRGQGSVTWITPKTLNVLFLFLSHDLYCLLDSTFHFPLQCVPDVCLSNLASNSFDDRGLFNRLSSDPPITMYLSPITGIDTFNEDCTDVFFVVCIFTLSGKSINLRENCYTVTETCLKICISSSTLLDKSSKTYVILDDLKLELDYVGALTFISNVEGRGQPSYDCRKGEASHKICEKKNSRTFITSWRFACAAKFYEKINSKIGMLLSKLLVSQLGSQLLVQFLHFQGQAFILFSQLL